MRQCEEVREARSEVVLHVDKAPATTAPSGLVLMLPVTDRFFGKDGYYREANIDPEFRSRVGVV